MSLRTAIPDFKTDIVRLEKGWKILEHYIKPLLAESREYLKISSFFTPAVIKSVLQELQSCFQQKGSVRLIIGIHDSSKLIPILDQLTHPDPDERFRQAVTRIVSQELHNAVRLLEDPRLFYAVMAELIRQDLIQIKIAAVRTDYTRYHDSGQWPQDDSIFHPKVSLFRDGEFTVSMNGSINSTLKGFGENVEDASFSGSWFSPKAGIYENIFEQIWNNTHEDSHTLDFNEQIRAIVSGVIELPFFTKPADPDNGEDTSGAKTTDLIKLLSNSPNYFHFFFVKVRLLPHQVAIYQSMLSRWPVQGLIADEVGLGKTIEAGAIVSYAVRFLNVKRIALLVPASLRGQWQSEMHQLFGLKFYIYEPDGCRLVFYGDGGEEDETTDIIEGVNPGNFFDHGIESIIFSWHYLRQVNADGSFRLSVQDNIDLMVVDEAHGARMSRQLNSEIETTRLYQLLDQLAPAVAHKLLLTATPFQTSVDDYISLINILMGESRVDESSMDRVSILNRNFRLENQQKVDAVAELVNYTAYKIDGLPGDLDSDDPAALFRLYSDPMYLNNHPTTIYTVRNTRDRLKAIGYTFPNTHISSHAIILETKQTDLISLITAYIDNQLFNFETSIGVRGLGLVKTIYSQRIVSSFQASYDTLEKRNEKLQRYIEKRTASIAVADGQNEDDADLVDNAATTAAIAVTNAEIAIAQTEIEYIQEILNKITRRLFVGTEIVDPKVEEAIRIIQHHLSQGDKVIVFSRFTSTTAFLVERLKRLNSFSFGRFEGDYKQVIEGTNVENMSRELIARRFAEGAFPVIVCSDAASEGLNLQSANVVINVDVPWNPARILQRFGRIDRFGQKKTELYFYNLFYPGTIEDRMYSRLHRRNLEFRELLGTTPDITSRGHLRDLNLVMDDTNEVLSYKNTLLQLQPKDNIRPHEIILERLNCLPAFEITKTSIRYENMLHSYSTDELDALYLDLNHPLFAEIDLSTTHLTGLYNSKEDLLFICVKDNDSNNKDKVYPLLNLSDILDHIVLNNWLSPALPADSISLQTPENDLDDFLKRQAKGVINHNKILFIGSSENQLYKGLHYKPLSV